jgi:hypothetical protein
MSQNPPFRVQIPGPSQPSLPALPNQREHSDALVSLPTFERATARALSYDPAALLRSIESPTPVAEDVEDDTLTRKKKPRKLEDTDKLIILQICQGYSRVCLDDKPMTQFWRLITSDFKKATNVDHEALGKVVLTLVTHRLRHLDKCGSGREPEGGDLNQAIDAWIEILKEKDTYNATFVCDIYTTSIFSIT